MRFKCEKKEPCKSCAECCRFREKLDFDIKEELDVKKALFNRTGTLYLYPFSRYTINISRHEKEVMEKEARRKGIRISILPKKIFVSTQGIIIYDYFVDAEVCPFLDKDNRCSIYEKRPQICKDFPHLKYDNSEFTKFVNTTNIIKTDYEKCFKYVQENLNFTTSSQ